MTITELHKIFTYFTVSNELVLVHLLVIRVLL